MTVLLFANNASSTLAGAISNTATSANLAAGTGVLFPQPGANQYFIGSFTDAATGLLHEIVWVTSVSSDTVTMVRAQEGTTALSWNSGDIFSNNWTAGSANTMVQISAVQDQATNYAADTGSGNSIVASLSPSPGSLSALIGAPVRIKKASTGNTGAVTLTLNGNAATPVVRPDGTALISGEWPPNAIGEVIYDGTNFELMSQMSHDLSYQYFTANGNSLVPAGKSQALVKCWAAGGGGGGTFGGSCGASGGAGGAYSEGVVTGLTVGNSISVSVGSGGTGGTNGSSPTNGNAGGSSSFGSYISCSGGGGGIAETGGYQQSIPNGGTASGGSLNISGDDGWAAFAIGSASYTAPGGASWGCGSTHPTLTNSAVNGNNGAFPGQGGCGGINGGSGGTGANGLVIVEYF